MKAKQNRKLSLRHKILGLVMTLSLLLIILLTAFYAYMESQQIKEDKGRLALEISKTVSFMPTVIQAFDSENPSAEIQPLADKIRKETGAEFIVVGNLDGVRYSHPDQTQIGKKMMGGDNDRAFAGTYYISEAQGSLGLSLRGKSPIFDKEGKVIGIVSAGFLVEKVNGQIMKDLSRELLFSAAAVLLSFIGSALLARNIRKETMGLEPYEIANLYLEKRAVLHSVKEGIISIDAGGMITSMNMPAKRLLGIHERVRSLKVDGLFPSGLLYEVLKTGNQKADQELVWKDKTIIVNGTPIYGEGKIQGVVASFRDKTELEHMVNTLSEVRMHSEDLRAQNHEFKNKLYVLSGLLQLGEYEEAISMIQHETEELQHINEILFEQIRDRKIQAILLGKFGKASEKKVNFEMDAESFLEELPAHISISQLILILGNLIDNAFEAVTEKEEPHVTFFATDIGEDIIFEVSDNGHGISDEEKSSIFLKGFSSRDKESPSGYGLFNANKAVRELKGVIEVQSSQNDGTVFTVYLPKKMGRGMDEENQSSDR
ncbi:ATP-binding protein [Bacillus massiliglaciei]|uniref:ATP-binding protein n=1 Tax=Bacillus massiliglaciei TaxID=1816693 RepID=UPI000AB55A91|nr:sensor histidine kinase [Bacillus massiliglaciei]